MPRRLLSPVVIGLLVAACGSSQPTTAPVITAAPTAAPTIAPAPTPGSTTAPTPASTGAFDGLPYSLSLPPGWTTFDLSDPAGAAALDDFVEANPEMGAAIQVFKALPNVVMAVNMLIGNVVVSLSVADSRAAAGLHRVLASPRSSRQSRASRTRPSRRRSR